MKPQELIGLLESTIVKFGIDKNDLACPEFSKSINIQELENAVGHFEFVAYSDDEEIGNEVLIFEFVDHEIFLALEGILASDDGDASDFSEGKWFEVNRKQVVNYLYEVIRK